MTAPKQSITIPAGAVESYLARIERLSETFAKLCGCRPDKSTEAKRQNAASDTEAFAAAAKELALRMAAHQKRTAAASRQAETLRARTNEIFA